LWEQARSIRRRHMALRMDTPAQRTASEAAARRRRGEPGLCRKGIGPRGPQGALRLEGFCAAAQGRRYRRRRLHGDRIPELARHPRRERPRHVLPRHVSCPSLRPRVPRRGSPARARAGHVQAECARPRLGRNTLHLSCRKYAKGTGPRGCWCLRRGRPILPGV